MSKKGRRFTFKVTFYSRSSDKRKLIILFSVCFILFHFITNYTMFFDESLFKEKADARKCFSLLRYASIPALRKQFFNTVARYNQFLREGRKNIRKNKT